MEDQEQKELRQFSWTICFSVTGLSFLLFSLFLKILDGGNSPLFMKVGLVSMGLAVLCFFNKWLDSKAKPKKSVDNTSSIFSNE